MRITNKSNLPKYVASVLEAAWRNSSYDGPKGNKIITVTQLIGPAQKLVLERQNDADLEMDVLDMVPALRGSALHNILEQAGKDAPTLIPEDRLKTMHDGWTISGKSDLYETADHILSDWKDSSVWSFIFGKIEWVEQLNVLRWIRVRNGQPVNGLAITLFCGDWRRNESLRSPDYPARVVNIPIPMWTMDEATAFVDQRLNLHRAANDGAIPPCSDVERWAKPTSWAVIKDGNKRAASVHNTEADAVANLKAGHHIEKRPGESVRCNGYCLARPFCPQAAKDPSLKENENG